MSTVYIQNADPSAACECDNCGHECNAAALGAVHDIEQRLEPGCPVPAGECPKCGALAYVKEEKRRALPDSTLYRVFSRKVYRRERNAFTGRASYVPNPGARRRTVDTVRGIEAARRLCEHGPANKALAAGKEYRGLSFYEFERV